jgi:hypothetical protein
MKAQKKRRKYAQENPHIAMTIIAKYFGLKDI